MAHNKSRDLSLELAAHFIVALYAATRGRSGRCRRIADCAERAGIKKAAEIKTAVSTAEKAGFLVVHVDEPAVMLTTKGAGGGAAETLANRALRPQLRCMLS